MITVLAATGFTGRLISQELAKRNIDFQIAGRSLEKLRELANSLGKPALRTQVVDMMRAETYQAALENTRVLINCAGPFTEFGIAIVRAAAERGIHYLDTTGEQSFIKQVAEICHPIAEANGSALIPACAFEYALGDAGAALAARGIQQCDDVNIFYAIGGAGASRGTKKSIVNALINPSYFYRDSKLVLMSPAEQQRNIEFPIIGKRTLTSFGGGEVLSVPRHVQTRNVSTFISAGGSALMLKLGMVLLVPLLKTSMRKFIFNQIDKQAIGPDVQEREKSLFTIICEAHSHEKQQRVIITGKDPYGLTGMIAAETAIRLLDADRDLLGFTSAARAFGPEMIKQVTETAGVNWQ